MYTVTIVSASLCVHKLNGMLEVFCWLVKESGRQNKRKSFGQVRFHKLHVLLGS